MTSDRRRWAMGVLVWVLVVLAGSSLVWVVISHAGAGVAPQPGTSVAAGDPAGDAAAPTSPPGTRPPRSTTARPTLRPAPAPSRTAPSPATATSTLPSPTPPDSSGPERGDDPGDDRGDDPGPGASTAQSAPSGSTGTSASRRTWSGTGGSVVVECTGSRIRLVAAQPDGGFAVEVGNRGPQAVEVAFHGRGEEERESEVHAVCAGGTPRFAAESSHDD